MCGIVGATARSEKISNVLPIILEGLKRLEYRGYDSCGVAFVADQQLARRRSTGRMQGLIEDCAQVSTSLAIGHTRWATHGKPSTDNAHPHFSGARFALVHNGIIENYANLRTQLKAHGFEFVSDTDTEVIVHLVAYESRQNDGLRYAVQRACAQLKGAYSIAVIDKNYPDILVGARAGSPLVVGYGKGHFLASDVMALAGSVDAFAYLEEYDVVELSPEGVQIFARDPKATSPVYQAVTRAQIHDISFSQAAELGPYRHFMQKEIFEQPRAVADTLQAIEQLSPELFGAQAAEIFTRCRKVHIIACGTSFYAGLVAQYWIEGISGLPVKVEIASEFRYRTPVLSPDTLLICISQSGETADTLSALRYAKTLNHKESLSTLAICNVASSALVRETDLHFITRAGIEVGVASTKAFTTQLVALYVLTQALVAAKKPDFVTGDTHEQALESLRHLPAAISQVLALEPLIMAWAQQFAAHENALFLGRGEHYPIALEGALKLKEISYIHAEAYPAGELKHGPLALVTSEMPVIVVAPNDQLLEKLHGNMQEVRARGGQLFVFADADAQITNEEGVRVITLPEHYGDLSPIVHVISLQLLAYHTALLRGTDVDKPRNLAKSVTVE